MFAEHTLGLADYLIRKATNMRVGFLDGKVKSKIKKTLLWLCSHPRDDQDKLVKQTRKVRHACQVHEENIAKIQDQRQKRMKEDSFRRCIERKLHSVANLEKEFPELSEVQRSTIPTVMSDKFIL